MNTLVRAGLFFILLLLLIGCNNFEEKDSPKITYENNNSTPMSNEEEKPPALKLTFGGVEVKTYKGTYTWTYFDKSTGQNITTQTDHAPPTEMVNTEQSVRVNLTKPVKLNFEKEPSQYEIRLWDYNGIIKTYKSFEEVEEKGKYIVEIAGNWEDSIATYAVALDFQ
ncbi:hypothetical protein [Jeotgalibacillus proteolyticus]|uniref:Lipoprotein n=1 Tax=Jeotgalibacillus proteolyticus TaxID=2082395 RepID=A0A2S5GDD7_9BACL|nr:hypothetical protein [Jeotgalibacillus proteolyticus]PPA71006.1 hypothetical protein C4B60_09505 [Jeotgalibacillus proteolyticus]